MEWIVRSPVKLNLTLRVIGKRPEGYHDLQSTFLRLEGPETIVIRERPNEKEDLVRVYNYPIFGENIMVKTLRELRRHGLPENPFEIDLFKQIPPGTGLGAGSGNSAALVEWARRYISPGILKGKEGELGGDVPFLSSGERMATVGGLGDIVVPLSGEFPFWACVIVPKWRSNTGIAYRRLDEFSRGRWLTEEEALEESRQIRLDLVRGKRVGLLPNDFLEVVSRFEPGYRVLLKELEKSGALAWGLSGSGSALFALIPGQVPMRGFQVGMEPNPLIERIYFWEW